MASKVGMKSSGWDEDTGYVERGKRASLVFLAALVRVTLLGQFIGKWAGVPRKVPLSLQHDPTLLVEKYRDTGLCVEKQKSQFQASFLPICPLFPYLENPVAGVSLGACKLSLALFLSIHFRSLRNRLTNDLLVHQTHWEMGSRIPSVEILLVLMLVNNSSKNKYRFRNGLAHQGNKPGSFSHLLFIIFPCYILSSSLSWRKDIKYSLS